MGHLYDHVGFDLLSIENNGFSEISKRLEDNKRHRSKSIRKEATTFTEALFKEDKSIISSYKRIDAREASRQMIAQIRETDSLKDLTAEDVYQLRLLASWRIIRELARLKGILKPGEGLDESLSIGPIGLSDWYICTPLDLDKVPSKREYKHFDHVIYTHQTIDNLPDKSNLPNKFDVQQKPAVGIPLLPPEAAPKESTKLTLYCCIIEDIIEGLGMKYGTKSDPFLGLVGIEGLSDPYIIHSVFPDPQDIIDLEIVLAEKTLDKLTQENIGSSERDVSKLLQQELSLNPLEASNLIKLAKNRATLTAATGKEERTTMILRLEHLIDQTDDINEKTRLLTKVIELKDMHKENLLSDNDEDDLRSIIAYNYNEIEKAEVDLHEQPAIESEEDYE